RECPNEHGRMNAPLVRCDASPGWRETQPETTEWCLTPPEPSKTGIERHRQSKHKCLSVKQLRWSCRGAIPARYEAALLGFGAWVGRLRLDLVAAACLGGCAPDPNRQRRGGGQVPAGGRA